MRLARRPECSEEVSIVPVLEFVIWHFGLIFCKIKLQTYKMENQQNDISLIVDVILKFSLRLLQHNQIYFQALTYRENRKTFKFSCQYCIQNRATFKSEEMSLGGIIGGCTTNACPQEHCPNIECLNVNNNNKKNKPITLLRSNQSGLKNHLKVYERENPGRLRLFNV